MYTYLDTYIVYTYIIMFKKTKVKEIDGKKKYMDKK